MHGFPFFSGDAVTAAPGYNRRRSSLSRARATLFWRSSAISSELHRRSFRSAPRYFQLSPEGHAKNGGLPGVWELGNALRSSPREHEAWSGPHNKWRKAGSLRDSRLEFVSCAQRAREKLSTGYPHLIKVGSLGV